MDHAALIDAYLAGPKQLRDAIAGMTPAQIDAAPVPGKWSTRQIICHIADFEPVYCDRMKRVVAEEGPTMFGGDPDLFAAKLAYAERDVEEELALIESVRRHVARILRTLPAESFQRTGNHAVHGPMTLEKLLATITEHIPHHLRFIEEKRRLL
ncbi:MAG: DinB family protein [Planctomycetales bacterium]